MKAVNLLPSDMRGAGKPASAVVAGSDEATGRVGAFAVLGVLAFCVVALAAYVLANNTVKDRKAELETATAQAKTVTRQADALKPYADFAAQAQERVQTVRDLAASRFDWEQAFRDIARVVPAEVTLSALNATISSQAGSSGSGLRSAIAAPAIDLTGCTNGGQRDVATLMSRLGNIDGVTRVSLSKSEKPDLAPRGTSTGTAAPTGTVATVTTGGAGCNGRATTFDVVVFFERSKVPATTDDVSVAGSGSTATSTTASSASSTTTAAPAATPAATPAASPTTSPAP
jgi:Tfp pilus assembly protein PilN